MSEGFLQSLDAAKLLRLYLRGRRRSPYVLLPFVVDSDELALDCGEPGDWASGIAERVQSRELQVRHLPVADTNSVGVTILVGQEGEKRPDQRRCHRRSVFSCRTRNDTLRQPPPVAAPPVKPASQALPEPCRIFRTLSAQRNADIRIDRLFVERFAVGTHALRGSRPYMEDRHMVVHDFDRLLRTLARVCPHDEGAAELQCDCYGTKATSIVRKAGDLAAQSWPLGANQSDPCATIPDAAASDSQDKQDANGVSGRDALRQPSEQGLELGNAPHADSAFHVPVTYVAVFDGHTGVETAEFCTAHLHRNIAMAHTLGGDLCDAIRQGTAVTEDAFLEMAREKKLESGSTACCAVLAGRQLYIGNVGDCRVVVSRSGEAFLLTQDHTPTRPDEKERIEREGGFIVGSRLADDLLVSRALGDLRDGVKVPGLSAVPDTLKYYLTEEDDFCVIACDGLWEAVTPQEAVKRVLTSLQRHGSVQSSCEELVEYAVHRSTDNVTAVIIGFRDVWPSPAASSRITSTASSVSRFDLQHEIDRGREAGAPSLLSWSPIVAATPPAGITLGSASPSPADLAFPPSASSASASGSGSGSCSSSSSSSLAAASPPSDFTPLPPPSAGAWRPRRPRVADQAKEELQKVLCEVAAVPAPNQLELQLWGGNTPPVSPLAADAGAGASPNATVNGLHSASHRS